MRKSFVALTLVMAGAVAAQTLFPRATESKWTVSKGSVTAGTVTLLTGSNVARAEWRSQAASTPVVFLGGQAKVWLRQPGGDVELSTISASRPEYDTVPALMLPFALGSVQNKSGKPFTYKYRGATATYTYDDKGPVKIEVAGAGSKYTLTRTALTSSSAAATNFDIRPRKGAASRLAQLSGSLLGPSDTTVSATAGGRGVSGKGMKLADGGDYDALLALETRDEKWKRDLEPVLAEFQKEGKVGKGREQ